MDRRAFLRRALVGTATVAVAHHAGWDLSTFKTWLGRWLRAVRSEPKACVMASDLDGLFKRIYSEYRPLLVTPPIPLLSDFRRGRDSRIMQWGSTV